MKEERNKEISKEESTHYKPRSAATYIYFANFFLTLLVILCAFMLFKGMDDIIPAHYDIYGNVTRYGNKLEYFFIPGLIVLYFPFSIVLHYNKALQKEYKKTLLVLQLFIFIAELLILFFSVWLGFKYTSNISETVLATTTGLVLALLTLVMFFSHPYFNPRRNLIYGVRTTFTLQSDVAWQKVNAFASCSGSIIILLGYTTVLFTFKNWNVYLFALIALALVPTFIYHEILRKKIKQSS